MNEAEGLDLEKKERNNGSYALDMDNKKISVTLSNGQHSILFEDIASTSFKTFHYKKTVKAVQSFKTNLITGLSFGLGIFLMIEKIVFDFPWWVGILVIIGGFIFSGQKQDTLERVAWDNVTIETQGGKQITYSVKNGQGKVDIDAIEEARRA